jgi:hypothetical protein
VQLQLRKTDRLYRYHEKSSMLRQEPKTPKPNATPHPAFRRIWR